MAQKYVKSAELPNFIRTFVLSIINTDHMAEHNELGKWGEQTAAHHLEAQGYTILARNWRFGRSLRDLDIVCKTPDGQQVVFVEVKTRTNDTVALPEQAVNRQKIRSLGVAAHHFIQTQNIREPIRFDIIAIVYCTADKSFKLKHITHAFNPLLL